MDIRLIASVALALACSSAEAEQLDVGDCAMDQIRVTDLTEWVPGVAPESLLLQVENGLPVPIGGIELEFGLQSDDRPALIHVARTVAFTRIAGGLLPGEVVAEPVYIFLDEREMRLVREAEGLRVLTMVMNVADPQLVARASSNMPGHWSYVEGGADLRCD